MAAAAAPKYISIDYKVFGKVQGVFFRKYTQQEATKLKLVGWVMNTEEGTVIGQMQGKEDAIKKMKDWLKTKGSPKSRIDKTEFNSEKEIKSLDFKTFEVRK